MKYFEQKFGKEGVTLTGYIHEKSIELSNVDVRPAVLIFPGGGYFMCSDREAEPVALAFLAEGYQAFVLRYSVGQEMPFEEAYDDAVRALAYLKEHHEELQLNPEKIAVGGFSAGGHLAASLGILGAEKPSAMILGYPVILQEFGTQIKKQFPMLVDKVDKSTPPAYVFTTCTDELVPVDNSLSLVSAMNKVGVPYEFHIFPDGSHGLSLAKSDTSGGKKSMVNASVQKWFSECCAWLKLIWGEYELNNEDLGLGMDSHTIGIQTPVSVLMEREDCKKVLLEIFPQLEVMLEQNPSSGTYSFEVMNQFSPEIITDEMLKAVQVGLENCKTI